MAIRWNHNYPLSAAVLLSAIVVIFVGCSAFKRTQIPHLPDSLPIAFELENVPFYPQTAYQCGPATLAMALTWSGQKISSERLKNQVYTPARKGSLQMDMVGATRRHGRIAYEILGPDAIFPELAGGHPVIVLQNLGLSWLPVWHYALVIGYDFNKEIIILHSGVSERKVMPYDTFAKTWSRSNYWGLLVLEPHKIPVVVSEKKYLLAIFGLERSRRFQAAAKGYQTALGRWSHSLGAAMGLGNCYYAMGDLDASEDAFRTAVSNHPQAGEAYNNLAQVLLEQGRKHEALEAIQKAIALGGPMRDTYEATLQEIQSQK